MISRPSALTRALIYLPALLFTVGGLTAGAMRLSAGSDHATRRHGHESVHGGVVQVLGRRHVELVVEAGGQVRLFLLGEDETELRPAPVPELQGHAQPGGAPAAVPLTLQADPLPGDPPGWASQFSGRLPPGWTTGPGSLLFTVPQGGRLYRARFQLEAQPHPSAHAEAPRMPEGAPGDEQRRLHLSPGGRYTATDIQANGRTTPAVKYRGLLPRHDLRPEPGDRLCPITRTRANPRFAWTVGGKSYSFCCPPCIDEFVQRAKQDSGSVRPPEEYVQR